MNKKIKIIELLNKIANGEKVPKIIKYNYDTFQYSSKWEQYIKEGYDEIPLLRIISDYNYSGLNDEVEILEDNTEEQENLGESWKEVGKRVGEWAKEFEQGFKESFTEIVRYPFEKLEDNTEEIEELSYEWTTNEIADRVDKLIKAVNAIRKDLNKC